MILLVLVKFQCLLIPYKVDIIGIIDTILISYKVDGLDMIQNCMLYGGFDSGDVGVRNQNLIATTSRFLLA